MFIQLAESAALNLLGGMLSFVTPTLPKRRGRQSKVTRKIVNMAMSRLSSEEAQSVKGWLNIWRLRCSRGGTRRRIRSALAGELDRFF